MATNKRYYWIKLKEEFFTENKQRTLSLMSPTHVRQEIEIDKDIEIDKERGRDRKDLIFLV